MFSRKLTLAVDVGSHAVRYAAVEPESGRVRTLWEKNILPERTSQDQEASEEQVETCLSPFSAVALWVSVLPPGTQDFQPDNRSPGYQRPPGSGNPDSLSPT